MKTSEIMLGDYFNVHPSNLPIKVAAVHKGKVGYHARKDRLAWVRADLLRPIPLTPEILEKDGFKKDERDENFYKWNWSVIDDCISYDKETGMVRIFNTSGLVFVKILSYLHELQHALRLCKIDKTIKI